MGVVHEVEVPAPTSGEKTLEIPDETSGKRGAEKGRAAVPVLRPFGSHGNVCTSDEVIERFYQEGISCEALADLAQIEAKAFLSRPVPGRAAVETQVAVNLSGELPAPMPQLPRSLRRGALSFLHTVVSKHFTAEVTWERWFEAVTLFDVYSIRRPGGADAAFIADLPVICTAIGRLVKKNDSQGHLPASKFTDEASQCSVWLNQNGFEVPAIYVTEKKLAAQERDIMEKLSWRMNQPTALSWIVAFLSRFNTLTGNQYLRSCEWMWPMLLSFMHHFAMTKECSADLPPRRIAGALLCLGLVNTRLLPETVVLPAGCGDDAVRQKILPHAVKDVQVLPWDSIQQLLDQLEIATGSSISELQEDCKAVLLAGFVDQLSSEPTQEQQRCDSCRHVI